MFWLRPTKLSCRTRPEENWMDAFRLASLTPQDEVLTRNEEMPDMVDLPRPIQAFVDSTNRGDADGVVGCFTKDAILIDWGRRFDGHAGVASWNKTDNTGVESHFDVLGMEPSARGYLVTLRVTGNGFNGTSGIDFGLSGDRISQLVIE